MPKKAKKNVLAGHPYEQLTHEVLLNQIVDVNVQFLKKEHEKARHLATISGGLLALVFAVIGTESFMTHSLTFRIGALIMLAGSLFSILVSLQATEVKLHKPSNKVNLFYLGDDFHEIKFDKYVSHLKHLVTNKKDLIGEYGMIIHELQASIIKKSHMTRSAVWILVGSVVIGGLLGGITLI